MSPDAPGPLLTEAAIRNRMDRSRETLLKFLENYVGPDPDREAQFERLVHQGSEGLRMLAAGDGERLGSDESAAEGLEAIIRTDGSRPSFLIREGEIDFESSPAGDWAEPLKARADALRKATACVGRIDASGEWQGTGFLVGPDVVLTNRYILQRIASQDTAASWKLNADAAIDFGHECRGCSVNRRKLKQVVFWGAQDIDFNAIDHAKLDMALIEVEPLPGGGPDPFVIQSEPPAPTFTDLPVVTVGYGGKPRYPGQSQPLLNDLFRRSFGYKRLAPGEVITQPNGVPSSTLRDDATTFGGNSGSVVISLTREGTALGLHYGRRRLSPTENWSHRLDLVLGKTNDHGSATLSEVLQKYGAKFSAPAPAATVRIEFYWADARELAKAEKLIADVGGRIDTKQQGRVVAQVPADRVPVCRETKIPCHVAPTTIPVPLDEEPASAAGGLEAVQLPPIRDMIHKSQRAIGSLWKRLQQQLDTLDDPAGASPPDESLLDEDSYVVKLAAPLKPQWRSLLEKYGRVVPYTDPDKILLRLRKPEVAAVRLLTGVVKSVRRYLPEDSMTPAMTKFLDEVAKAQPEQWYKFDVLLHQEDDLAAFDTFLQEQPPEDVQVVKQSKSSPSYRIAAPAGSPVLAAIPRLPQVRTITPYQPPRLEMDAAGDMIGCREIGTAPNHQEWTGKKQVVAVFDSGIDAAHPDLADALAFSPMQYGAGQAVDTNGHGTHVAGIIAGRGSVVRGVAPGCRLLSCGITDVYDTPDVPNDLSDLLQVAVEASAKIINLSWRAGIAPEYNFYGYSLDQFARDNPDVLVVVAAGNQGTLRQPQGAGDQGAAALYLCSSRTIGNPASAKNAVTVGGVPELPARVHRHVRGH